MNLSLEDVALHNFHYLLPLAVLNRANANCSNIWRVIPQPEATGYITFFQVNLIFHKMDKNLGNRKHMKCHFVYKILHEFPQKGFQDVFE